MNNAQLYTLVTKLEQAERAHLLGGQRRAKQGWLARIAAVIAQVTDFYQRWKAGKPTRAGQAAAEVGGAGWRPASEVVVDQPLGVE